tara:strand:- start:62 stop:184 length:123 start_codon:yes stop_codon:yes gene_type:complete
MSLEKIIKNARLALLKTREWIQKEAKFFDLNEVVFKVIMT